MLVHILFVWTGFSNAHVLMYLSKEELMSDVQSVLSYPYVTKMGYITKNLDTGAQVQHQAWRK